MILSVVKENAVGGGIAYSPGGGGGHDEGF